VRTRLGAAVVAPVQRMKKPNQSVEATGGSRFCPSASLAQRRLPPLAHARRSMKVL
jgi:hypothetical protein